mmetsp:Transcript_20155/g.41788  ORF Transcript_20155/g.41788 Transcript_20155/m.41788 type:complete len:126 (+) Transcript_20155:1614-1991(+)
MHRPNSAAQSGCWVPRWSELAAQAMQPLMCFLGGEASSCVTRALVDVLQHLTPLPVPTMADHDSLAVCSIAPFCCTPRSHVLDLADLTWTDSTQQQEQGLRCLRIFIPSLGCTLVTAGLLQIYFQ